jgi:hypothetical protein
MGTNAFVPGKSRNLRNDAYLDGPRANKEDVLKDSSQKKSFFIFIVLESELCMLATRA